MGILYNAHEFEKFVNEHVYWWGEKRPAPDVNAALRFILAKQPRYVEQIARDKFGFTDNDFKNALMDTPPGLFWGPGAKEYWYDVNRRLGITPSLPFPESTAEDWKALAEAGTHD